MSSYLLTFIIFASLPVCFFRPYIGLLVWAWIGYMNPHRLIWGFADQMPFVQIVAIATLLGFIFSKDRQLPPLNLLVFSWIFFVFWMFISTNFSLNEVYAWQEWERVLKIQLMVLMTLLLINSKVKINHLVWVVALSIGFFGIKGGLFAIKTGGNYLVWGPPNSFITGNNEIALALLMVIPLFRYLQLQAKSKLIQWMLLSFIALSCLAVLATHSRGALLAGAVMIFALVVKGRYKITFGVLAILFSVSAINFMPEHWKDRMSTISSYEEDASAQGRIGAWTFAIRLANDRPFVGGGFQTFIPSIFFAYMPESDNSADAHSIYFEVLGEHGYVGLILFLMIGFLVYATCRKIILLSRDPPELKWANDLARMLQVSLIGYAVGGAFLGLAYFDLPYHIMAMSLVLYKCVQKEIRKYEIEDNSYLDDNKFKLKMPIK